MASSKSSQHGRHLDVRPLDNRMPTKNNNKQKHKKTKIIKTTKNKIIKGLVLGQSRADTRLKKSLGIVGERWALGTFVWCHNTFSLGRSFARNLQGCWDSASTVPVLRGFTQQWWCQKCFANGVPNAWVLAQLSSEGQGALSQVLMHKLRTLKKPVLKKERRLFTCGRRW